MQFSDHCLRSGTGLSFDRAQLVREGYIHQHRMTPVPRLKPVVFPELVASLRGLAGAQGDVSDPEKPTAQRADLHVGSGCPE